MARTKVRSKTASGKRKRDGEDNEAPRAKKHEAERPEQKTYDEAIAQMDPSLISDHLAKALKRFSKNSTTIELEDKHIPTRAIRDTTSFAKPHLAKHLPEYLEAFGGGKDELTKGEVAAPHTLIITSSGIRAADLVRQVRVFQSSTVKVAKLFAKHFKVEDNVAFLGQNKVNIGIGTPHRPMKLIKDESLKLQNLRRIVIDGSYTDEKKRTIFDVPESFHSLIDIFNMNKIKEKLGAEENGIEVLVF